MRPRRVLHSPTAEPEPFDAAAFPGLDERRRADGGAASQRWRELIASNVTVMADGAMGTMLFANGLLFGDPPEVWNLSKPDVVRRIHRGYLDAGSQAVIPAEIEPALADKVRRLAVAAFKAVDAAGLARVDFFLDRTSGHLYLNEINTMPGFTEISMYPKLWAASGISFPELVTRIAELALERFSDRSRNQTNLNLE